MTSQAQASVIGNSMGQPGGKGSPPLNPRLLSWPLFQEFPCQQQPVVGGGSGDGA